ncbi:MAG: DDE transposase family protein [Bacteroidetes bacterium]|nr:DDE transposase family protein [Bacteroidota bacterium]
MDNKKKKEYAKTLYLKEGITMQKELAVRVGVSENTMSRWMRNEGWEKLRKNILLTREEQIQHLLSELEEINGFIKLKPKGERFASSKEADIRRKIIKDIKELETNASLAEIIDTAKKYTNWLAKIDFAKAKEAASFFDLFIKENLK